MKAKRTSWKRAAYAIIVTERRQKDPFADSRPLDSEVEGEEETDLHVVGTSTSQLEVPAERKIHPNRGRVFELGHEVDEGYNRAVKLKEQQRSKKKKISR
jgi:hypothetical protein